ncbi:MAG: hypothetical protein V4570_00245 [Pseudomonadota bacterium]
MRCRRTIKLPVRRLYTCIDAFVKPDAIEKMQAELEKSGSGSEIIVFPNFA